jgi:hypothetical protein
MAPPPPPLALASTHVAAGTQFLGVYVVDDDHLGQGDRMGQQLNNNKKNM